MNRPNCRLLSACLLLAALPAAGFAGETEFAKKTYVYKTVGDVKIEADVYRHADERPRPVLVWIHGGALINGSRAGVPGRLRELARGQGYALVSLDYRLAPEVKLPAIIEDIRDAFAWIREKGPELFHADTGKLVVSGGSAGGYLTMMTGIAIEPRPTALVAFWGYGDVDGDWYTKPSEHYRKAVPLIDRDEAFAAVNHGVLTGVNRDTPHRQGRGRFYLYLRQNGLWTREVTGFDAATQRDKLTPYCPVRNITPAYPPILMVHGTADTDVPYQLSADMAKALARHKVRHELVTVEGAGHGLSRGDPEKVNAAHERALAFIREHLSP